MCFGQICGDMREFAAVCVMVRATTLGVASCCYFGAKKTRQETRGSVYSEDNELPFVCVSK